MAGDITLALRTAQSGLLANQAALNTLANNISNVNTPGYSRKIVTLEQQVVGSTGAGVQISEITRVVDEGLLKTLRRELADFNYRDSQVSYFERLQDLFGAPGDNTSMAHALNELSQALEGLAISPDKSLDQTEVARQAQDVVLLFQSMSETIQDLRLQADLAISDEVDRINILTDKIADLNDKIIRNQTVSSDVSDLQDQRDIALDELAGLLDVRYFSRGDGDIVVFTTGGRILVDNQAETLTHTAASAVTTTTTHAEGDLTGIYIGDATSANDITEELTSGTLKGLVEMRDNLLPDLQIQLDTLAAGLRDAVNQVHNRGLSFPGLQTMTGTRHFLDTSAGANVTEQTIQLDPTNGADDVTIVLFDANGDQSAVTTLNAIMTGAGLSARGAGGDWTIAQVAAQTQTWLQANGAASASVGLNNVGQLTIQLNTTSLSLAFRDQTASANGSTHADAEIGFDADGDGTVDETVNGFSYFFGLNDFFVDGIGRNVHESNVVETTYTTPATTLRFIDGTATLPLDPGGASDVTLSITAGSTLEEVAQAITLNIADVTASVIPDGNGQRLRISHDDGRDLEIVESGAGGLLSAIGMHNAETRAASQIDLRSDIASTPAKIARGAIQWDANLGTAGEYYVSVGDDTIAKALAERFDTNVSFAEAGGISAVGTTLTEYATSVLARASSLANSNETRRDEAEKLTNALQQKSDSTRGVNLDEEMSDLIRFEQAYSAAARVIATIRAMFDALERTVG